MNAKFITPVVQIAGCAFMLMASFYFEYIVQLTPCVLCTIQRVIIEILLFVSCIHLLLRHKSKAVLYCSSVCILFCILGLLLALRQSWMQMNPGLFPDAACLPDLGYMFKVFSIPEMVTAILKHGGAECIKMKWSLLGIPMPGWLAFSYTMLLSAYVYGLAPLQQD